MTEPGRKSAPVYPPIIFALAVALMVGLHYLLPVRHLVSGGVRFAGGVAIALALCLILWAARLFSRDGTTIKPFEVSTTLVRRGPYTRTRNPMYLGMAVALMGVALLLGSLTPWLVIPLFMLLIDRRFIRAEEAVLSRTFGAEYAVYKTKVRRWV